VIRDTVWKCGDVVKVYADPSVADSSKCDFLGHVVSSDEDPFVLVYPPWGLALIADIEFSERVIARIAKQQPDKNWSEWLFRLSTL